MSGQTRLLDEGLGELFPSRSGENLTSNESMSPAPELDPIAALEARVAKTVELVAQLRAERDAARAELAQANQLCGGLGDDVREAREQVSDLMTQLSRAQADIADSSSAGARLQLDRDQAVTEVARLSAEVARLEGERAQVRSRVSKLMSQIDLLSSEA